MIEKTILEHLTGAGVTAYMEVPAGGGAPPFCIIDKTGGTENNRLKHATVAIQSYGASLYGAASLNEQIVALMGDSFRTLPEIASCDLNSDYNYTDTTKKQYRYQAVFDIVYYDN